MSEQPVVFGPFVFDRARGTLRRNGSPVAIGNRGMALLQALLDADGEVVTKSALMDAAWPNASIEESNLTVQIAALRKSLGESAEGEEWIATVPRMGYRLIRSSTAPKGPPLSLATSVQAPEQKPSIAVLPFTNMSSDPEQEYFAEGLSEDLITDLSKVPGLLVIARNSSFAYKGRSLDVRQIAKELSIRYIVEGSVRRAATRVRITAQLIDATDNSHIWADRFDRDLADVFELQDEVVGKIVNALGPVLPSARPVFTQRATSLEAYDLFVRGRVLALQSFGSNTAARPILEKAVAIDPGFADALAWLAMTYLFGWLYWQQPEEPDRSLGRANAERAVQLDPNNADARWILGYVRAYDRNLAESVREFETALRINPNHADAWAMLTDLRVFEGKPAEAIECARRAFRLNPYPPGVYYWVLGWALYAAGRYSEAVETLSNDAASGTGAQRLLAGSLAQLGRLEEARKEARLYLATIPHFSVRHWGNIQPFQHDADRQHFIDGYVKAGLPM